MTSNKPQAPDVQTQNVTPAPTLQSPVLVPAIVGSTVGVAGAVIALLLIVLWRRKKPRERAVPFDQRASFNEPSTIDSSISTQRHYHDPSDVRAPQH